MNNKKEKPNLVHIVVEAAIPILIGLLFSTIAQWITMESVIVNISSSAELEGKYLTVIGVQNLRGKTLSGLSLYIDEAIDILDVESDDSFNLHQQYITSDRLSPKSESTVAIWTQQPILKGNVTAESEYKTELYYSQNRTPFIFRFLWITAVTGVVMIIGSSVTLWISKSQIMKVRKGIQELQQKSEKLSDEVYAEKEQDKKERKEVRLYYLTRISDLQKELSFWRDTVRKMLYNSQNALQTSDKVIDTVTSTLKTYTTRERSNENVDELFYLAQLISDSKELDRKKKSSDPN